MSQRPRLVLTFDLEDWHQIVHRSLGVADWDRPHEAFERQVGTLLGLLDELDVRATFFVLGMCAKNHPDAVREIAARGHELASHGFEHVPVHRQTPDDFCRDVEASIELVESLAGRRPVRYRAPALLTEPSLLDVGCGSGRVGERVLMRAPLAMSASTSQRRCSRSRATGWRGSAKRPSSWRGTS